MQFKRHKVISEMETAVLYTNIDESFKPFGNEGVLTIIGVGLISGSFALMLKQRGIVKKVIGVSRTVASAQKALELGIIDEALPMEEAVKQGNLIYVAIPVNATIPAILEILDLITEQQIVVDAGSTKDALCLALKDHPMRSRFGGDSEFK